MLKYLTMASCLSTVQASDEEKYDLVREGVVIFTGALAKHLAKVIDLLSYILGLQ